MNQKMRILTVMAAGRGLRSSKYRACGTICVLSLIALYYIIVYFHLPFTPGNQRWERSSWLVGLFFDQRKYLKAARQG